MLDKIVRSIILMLLGAMIYGFVEAALEAYGSRLAGNIGGEIFVIPMILGFIWLGWTHGKDVTTRRLTKKYARICGEAWDRGYDVAVKHNDND